MQFHKTELTADQQSIRNANRDKPAHEVIDLVRANCSDALPYTEIVGRWVWVTFPDKPAPHVTLALKLAGFRYNAKRMAWQHSCGLPTFHAPYNPKDKYIVEKVA